MQPTVPPRTAARVFVLAPMIATALVLAAFAALVLRGTPAWQGALDDGSSPPVEVLMPDTDRSVDELVQLVREVARRRPDTQPDRDVQVILTDRLPPEHDQPLFGGFNAGSTVWVRVGLANPTRTLLHEVAHALTRGAGHDEPFRSVYLAAVGTAYDGETASRENRRLAWVYDRCHLDDSCPELVRSRAIEHEAST